ncbi:hypothetical protein PybrP1_009374 [[Pythium] brassicae (nom. inval.)]|nr:hypothetical protein PybrP1_009374 [[Pythium] brassicae (nom. inval.)]
MAKFPLPADTFPRLELPAQDAAEIEALSALLVQKTLAQYHEHAVAHRGVVDALRWKLVRAKDDVRVFKQRSRKQQRFAAGESYGDGVPAARRRRPLLALGDAADEPPSQCRLCLQRLNPTSSLPVRRKPGRCAACLETVCSKCRETKKLSFMSTRRGDGSVTQAAFTFCVRCLQRAYGASALAVARDGIDDPGAASDDDDDCALLQRLADSFDMLPPPPPSFTRSLDGRFRDAAPATRAPPVRALALAVVVVGVVGVSLLSVSYRAFSAPAAVGAATTLRHEGGNDTSAFTPPVMFDQCVNSDHIALTFDDGPSVWTFALLDIFARHDVNATFFFLGANLEHDATNRRAAQLAYKQGHEVASHTWSHTKLEGLSAAAIREELRKTSDVLQNVTGHRPRYMRPPYGATNRAVDAVIFEEGYKSMLWSCDSIDWHYTLVDKVTKILGRCNLDGLVLLLHEGRRSTVEAVEKFIVRVRAEHPEKRFVRADVCLGDAGDAGDAGAATAAVTLTASSGSQ